MYILSIKDNDGNWLEIPAIKGNTGATGPEGPQGPAGEDYVITSDDYNAIAAIVYNNYMTNAENVGY